jgi:hypothetical protein
MKAIQVLLAICIIAIFYASIIYAANSWYETAESSTTDYGFPSTQIIPGGSTSGDVGGIILLENTSFVSAQYNISAPPACLSYAAPKEEKSESNRTIEMVIPPRAACSAMPPPETRE